MTDENKRETRSFGHNKGTYTPWGRADGVTKYGVGVNFYSTPGHGGFKVADKKNLAVPKMLRLVDGWYEEDCDWCRVAIAFPELFTVQERQDAVRTLRDWYPDAFEAFYGVILEPGQSHVKDERDFYKAHENDYIVISASYSKKRPDMVEVDAVRGGRDKWRDNSEIVTFYVPAAEYALSPKHGFVIDESRHERV